MRERKIQAVIFDMDGLMFDSERIVKLSWNEAGEQMGYGALGENIVNTLGMNVVARERYFKEKYGETFPFETFSELTREFFGRYIEEHGLPAKKGLYELLEYLRDNGYQLAVASSSRRAHLMRNLTLAGIENCFQAILDGGMVKEAKPAPDIYEKTCEALGVAPSRALVLEDAPNGVRAAYAAGIPVIVIPDLLEPDAHILSMAVCRMDSLLEVMEFLKKEEE